MLPRLAALPLLLSLLSTAPVAAEGRLDEPGLPAGPDEPGLAERFVPAPSFASRGFRVELGFGWASLLEDPEVGEGYGGGLYLSYEFYRRLGAEFSLFFSKNAYEDSLGEIGTNFIAGNLTLGPTVRLTSPSSRWLVTADAAIGAYLIVPVMQDNVWTLGLSTGMTVGLKLARWFGVAVKLRYHLFNLATLSGPDLKDLKALLDVGVIDRLELPVCMSFYF